MNYKITILIFLLFIGCKPTDNQIKYSAAVNYSNSGFTLIFDENLFKKNIVSNRINTRSLIIHNKTLKKGTLVRITNPLNDKYLIAQIGKSSNYPNFYNSVISQRIAEELEIDPKQPYINLQTINLSSTTIANKAVTYEEERKVADKAPVEGISIKNIGIENNNTDENVQAKIELDKFNYIIKIADLFFEDSALMLKKRLENEFNIQNILIKKMSQNTFRVYKGPFIDLDSIKNEFNNIDKLKFENIEILKL